MHILRNRRFGASGTISRKPRGYVGFGESENFRDLCAVAADFGEKIMKIGFEKRRLSFEKIKNRMIARHAFEMRGFPG